MQVSVRLDVLLIVCQAKRSFFFFFKKKPVQKAPYGALMLESAVKKERDGREEKWREGGNERHDEKAFSLAFLPLSLSSPMSETDGAGALCVCICACKHLQVQADVIHPNAHTHKHTHKHTHYWALPLILPPAGRLRAATRLLPSAVSQPRGSDSSSAVR